MKRKREIQKKKLIFKCNDDTEMKKSSGKGGNIGCEQKKNLKEEEEE